MSKKVIEHFSGQIDGPVYIRYSDRKKLFEAFDEDGNCLAECDDNEVLGKHLWVRGAMPVKHEAHPTAYDLVPTRRKT